MDISVTLAIFGNLPFRKSPIWFSFLPGGRSPRRPVHGEKLAVFSLKLWSTVHLHHTGCAVSPPGPNRPRFTECPADRFVSSPSHFPVYHISCILACPDRISSIHDAISLRNSLRCSPHSSSECTGTNTGHTSCPGARDSYDRMSLE